MTKMLEVFPGWKPPVDESTLTKATPTTTIDVNSFDPLLQLYAEEQRSTPTVEPDAVDDLGKAMNWAAGEVARTPSAQLHKRTDLSMAVDNGSELETPMFDAAALFKALVEGQQVEQLRKNEGRVLPVASQRERMLDDWKTRHGIPTSDAPLEKRAGDHEARLRSYREKVRAIFSRCCDMTEETEQQLDEGLADLLTCSVEEEFEE